MVLEWNIFYNGIMINTTFKRKKMCINSITQVLGMINLMVVKEKVKKYNWLLVIPLDCTLLQHDSGLILILNQKKEKNKNIQ